MGREHERLALALLLSLLIHALLLSLTFGGEGLGLPAFGFPWRDRRIEAPEVRVVLVPTQVAVDSGPASIPSVSLAPPLRDKEAASGPARNTVHAKPKRNAVVPAAPVKTPARGDRPNHAAASQIPEPSVGDEARSDSSAPAADAASAAETPVIAVPPGISSPEIVPPALEDAGDVPGETAPLAAQQEAQREEDARQQEAARRDAERETAERLAAQQEAQRQEAARQEEAARVDAARRDAEHQEAERLAAQQEAQRQEAAREEEAARVEAARREAERREAERLAAQQEAQRREAARQEEAARVEAARREAERQAAERLAAQQEAQRQEAARARAEQEEAAARREARLRAIGRQLDEEAARREASSSAASARSTLPLSLSTARRARLWGRADPNVELIRYAEAWERTIQLNTPVDAVREVAKRLHNNPMVTVAIRSDGSVESVTFVVSSGMPEVDEAIRRIVKSREHYQAFPPALAREVDVIEIRRTWYFDTAIRFY